MRSATPRGAGSDQFITVEAGHDRSRNGGVAGAAVRLARHLEERACSCLLSGAGR
jgi:hypothetical protein